MLLGNNTKNVIALVNMVDKLSDIDKVRLAIHLFKNLGFVSNYNINNLIKLFQEVLLILDSNYKKAIINFAKYENLLFISAKYMELSLLEKEKFSVELLFNVFQYYFNNEEINIKIHKQLNMYDYYCLLNIL